MERRIAWYEATLEELDELAQTQPFAGPSGFFGWERLKGLLHQLRAAFDRYELEGDVAPVRREVDAYLADLAAHQLRPDAWVTARLQRFVEGLQGAPTLTIETRIAAEAPAGWPDGVLAVSPQELAALHASFNELR